MSQVKKIGRLCIIGVGLIGGSFARAIRQAGLVDHIIGCGRQLDNLTQAVDLGVIDDYSQSIATAVAQADLIFIATPVGSFEVIFQEIQASMKEGAIITDAGSTKKNIIDAAERVFSSVPPFFVPGHPIAGTENSGVEASFAELYVDHRVILTPSKKTDQQALTWITQLWQAIGAQVVTLDAVHHDSVLAATSHLPHLLAFSLVNTLTTLDEKQEIFDNAAGGFRDFTRIASSDPNMWQDICLANKTALLTHLDLFSKDLERLRQALLDDDATYLKETFQRAKLSRDEFVNKTVSS